jgi:RNA polymerase sigma-70 factor, ECF subfamily
MSQMSRKNMRERYPTLSDANLLKAVFYNDEIAWRELIRRFRGLIYRCITKVLCKYESVLSNEEVNEIFSEVCLNLLRDDMKKLRAYDSRRGSKLGSWIGLISINTAYDHLRVTARQPLLDRLENSFEREDYHAGPLEMLLEKERWLRLSSLTSDFSPKDQTFVELYFSRGMAPTEVARLMKISIKTVYSKKNKIQNRLVALAHALPPEAMAA